MAKQLTEVFDSTQEFFDKAVDKTSIPHHVSIQLFANNRLKKPYVVKRADDYMKHMNDIDVIIEINEKIFDALEPGQKDIVADEALAHIRWDMEKDKLNIDKPDVTTFSGIIHKYGLEPWNRLQETIKSLKDKKKQEEAEQGQTEGA